MIISKESAPEVVSCASGSTRTRHLKDLVTKKAPMEHQYNTAEQDQRLMKSVWEPKLVSNRANGHWHTIDLSGLLTPDRSDPRAAFVYCRLQ